MNSVQLFFDEDDDKLAKLELLRKRKLLRDLSNPLELDENSFRNYFRLSKHAFKDLLDDISPKLRQMKRLSSVPNLLKLASALRFFAEGAYQKGVGNDFNLGIAQPTFSLILKEMVDILETQVCPKWITFDYSEEDKRAAKIYFFKKCLVLPGVIGCVDGTHIRIINPGEQRQHLFYNRKGFHSINAMLICDHQMEFRYVNAKHPGASHDSMIWNVSGLKAIMQNMKVNGDKSWLLGDSGYSLDTSILTPFRAATEGTKESKFNKQHSIGRNIIERAIGVLKGRVRCSLGARQLHYSPQKATQITNICVALHNICTRYKIQFPDELHLIPTDSNIFELADEEYAESVSQRQAVILRYEIANSL